MASISDAGEEDDTWEEDWGEEEGCECVSLFSGVLLPSVKLCCEHDAEHHGFDIRDFRAKHGLDDYGTFKCINFIRRGVAGGSSPLAALAALGPAAFEDDDFLRPHLQEDALLFHDFANDAELTEGLGVGSAGGAEAPTAARVEAEHALADEVQALRAEKEALLEALQKLRLQALPAELLTEVCAARGTSGGAAGTSEHSANDSENVEPGRLAADATPCDSDKGKGAAGDARGEDAEGAASKEGVDAAYFDSYSYFDIHREMLEDNVRTTAYREALETNPALVRGASVVDVGCGTGILSLFAARGGAQRVVAVDAAERIASYATKNCIANGAHDSCGGPITVVAGKVEDIECWPLLDKADIIVSEWMGYALLFESMLESVLVARDRWLKPGGAILPDTAVLYVAAGNEAATGVDFWDEVYGFEFPDVKESVREGMLRQPLVAPVATSALMSPPATVKEFDLTTMRAEDVDFHANFLLEASVDGGVHALVLWFDTLFSERFCAEHSVVLTTSPLAKQTHWVQTVFVLRDAITVCAGDKLQGRVSFARCEKHRSMDISFELQHVAADGSLQKAVQQAYVMEVSSK